MTFFIVYLKIINIKNKLFIIIILFFIFINVLKFYINIDKVKYLFLNFLGR